MKTAIAKALFNSYSYAEYRKLISDLLLEGKATGKEQSENLTHYSLLNQTRMLRLDKTIKITDTNKAKLNTLKQEYIWLVISEGWCGDAAQLLPIFHKMTLESNRKIEMKIILRDENEEVMHYFLTNGTRSIPKLIFIDKQTGSVLGDWGPRPKEAIALIKNYKSEHTIIDETAKTALQLWYLHNKGLSTQNEIIDLMQNL
jgi:thioredoxin-like negative regulator of GroEL